MIKNILNHNRTKVAIFFWNHEYPARSFIRIYVLLSLSIYFFGRLVDPGPDWLQGIIQYFIHRFNLEVIQLIGLLGYKSGSFWNGSGLALQLQLLIAWPIMIFFSVTACLIANYYQTKDSEWLQVVEQDGTSYKTWLSVLFLFFFLLFIIYTPYFGSDWTKHRNYTVFYKIFFDTIFNSIYWILAGCFVIAFSSILFFVVTKQKTN